PGLGHADRKHDQGGSVFAVGGPQPIVAAVLLRRLPMATEPDAERSHLGKGDEAALHLGTRWEIRAAIHHTRHDRPAGRRLGEKAVPVVTLVHARLPLMAGEGLGPAEHPLENRPSTEHPTRSRIDGKHRVVDTEAIEAVGELKSARAAAYDDQ